MIGSWRLVGIEMVKQTRRAKGWVILGVVAAVPVLLTVVIGVWAPTTPERVGDWISVTTDGSGFALPLVAVNAMVIFLLPLAVAVFAGEAVAGEAGWGSLRYLLARPVSRGRVLWSKAAVAAVWSAAAVVVAVAVAVAAGVAAFGWRPLVDLDLQHTTPFHLAISQLGPWSALGHLALAGLVVGLELTSTFAFTLFLSTLTTRPFSAVAGGVGFGFVSRALDNIPGLHALGPWLPLTDTATTAWAGLFGQPAQVSGAAHLVVVQALYSGAFLVAAALRFTRSDVLA